MYTYIYTYMKLYMYRYSALLPPLEAIVTIATAGLDWAGPERVQVVMFVSKRFKVGG